MQAASGLTVDGLTLYAASAAAPPALATVTPATDLAALSAGLAGSTGQSQLSLPADGTVLIRDLAQQVFLVMQYHFTVA